MGTNITNNQIDSHKGVSKSLIILATFSQGEPMQRTSDIAAKLNMNISTVSRHLNILLDEGFLDRDEHTGYYHTGYKILELAGAELQCNDLYRHAQSEMRELCNKQKLHCHIGRPRKLEILHLLSHCSEDSPGAIVPMGYRHPMYCSATGRAILAFLPKAKARGILEKSDLVKFTPDTKIEMAEIEEELAIARKNRYAVISNELIPLRGGIAAPIFDNTGMPIATFSVSLSTQSLTDVKRTKELGQIVTSAATSISDKLGYWPY